tara:strand:- start:237 stop:1973 length:1737 start_codon:yes stop_codon:yes gene_type:complete
MAFSKARRLSDLVSATGEVSTFTDASIVPADLHATLDLTGKTITVATASASDNDTTVASTAFVQQELASLVDSAPGTLNTLNELAAALGDDASFSTTVTNSIATKLPLAGGTLTGDLNVQADGAEIFLKSADYNVARIIPRGSSGNDLDKGLLSLFDAGTEDIRIDTGGNSWINSGNNLGIGTTSPAQRLHVDGSAYVSGNVGVGTNSPDCDLHINGATNSEQVIITGGGNASRGLSISTVANNGQSNAGVIFNAQDTEHATYPALIFQTGGTEGMRIDGSGNVAIGGETTPLASLHIKQGDSGLSSINAAAHHIFLEDTGSNGPGMTMASGTSSNCTLAFGDSDSNYQGYILYDNSADTFKIGTGGTGEKLSINSNGYVILNHAASEYGLELRSTGTRSGLVIATPNSGNTIKGSALLLADDTFRLGTQSVYNIHMYQSGYVTTPNQAYARFTKGSNQTINNWTKINDFSAAGTSSSSFSTTNQRFTIPISGRYLVDSRISYATAISYNYTAIYINGSPYAYNQGSNTSFGNDTTIGGSQIMDLNSNDYIELWAYSPGNATVQGGSTRTYWAVMLLG